MCHPTMPSTANRCVAGATRASFNRRRIVAHSAPGKRKRMPAETRWRGQDHPELEQTCPSRFFPGGVLRQSVDAYLCLPVLCWDTQNLRRKSFDVNNDGVASIRVRLQIGHTSVPPDDAFQLRW